MLFRSQIAHVLESVNTLPVMPPSTSSETWQSITTRLKGFTIEKQNQQRQAVNELLQQWATEDNQSEYSEI